MKKYTILMVILCVGILINGCTQSQQPLRDKLVDTVKGDPNKEVDVPSNNQNNDNNIDISQPYVTQADMVITRALAAKMIALANFDKSTIQISDREIEFDDTNPEHWFDKYINMVVINGWMLGNGNKFQPLSPLSYEEMDTVCNRFNISLEGLGVKYSDKNKAVGYEEFMTFYDAICEANKDDGGVTSRRLIVFATPANSADLNAWNMATNYGKYSFEGLALDCYMDKEIEVILRGREIIAVKGVTLQIPKLTNVYIENIKDNKATVFMGGISRELTINHDEYKDIEQVIGDLIIEKDHITGILIKENTVTDKVLLISDSQVYFESKGTYDITKDAKFYSDIDGVQWKDRKSIIVGYETADFILDEKGRVCAAIIRKKVEMANIRVLISTEGFKSKYHQEVRLTGTTDYVLTYGNNKKELKAEEEIIIDGSYFDNQVPVIVEAKNQGKITINSIKRGYGSSMFMPSYRGRMEIRKTDEGYLIVNELPIEEYLYAVVPSEMPTSYGLEASKTQAICARSYAYSQFYSNRYCSYGAHVIDSVSSQVYNNIPENETSIQAVKATNKQGLTYNGNVISANFFSTSYGFTSNSGDVWAHYSTKGFPTNSPEYLRAKPQYTKGPTYDNLSDEKTFRKFIEDDTLNSYDKAFSYYRWSVELTREHIEASINANLGKRYKEQPKLIKTLDENGIFRSRPIDSIGALVDIGIYKRGEGGNITEMIIEGTAGIVKVVTEYNIRLLVTPVSHREGVKTVPVKLHTKKEATVKNLMPSAFYTMDKVYDKDGNLEQILFRGGGNGHGVGMSQNGVKGMVDLGNDYKSILKHYYEGTEVEEIY